MTTPLASAVLHFEAVLAMVVPVVLLAIALVAVASVVYFAVRGAK